MLNDPLQLKDVLIISLAAIGVIFTIIAVVIAIEERKAVKKLARYFYEKTRNEIAKDKPLSDSEDYARWLWYVNNTPEQDWIKVKPQPPKGLGCIRDFPEVPRNEEE